MKHCAGLFALLIAAQANAQSFKFDFTQVAAYTQEKGFGFEFSSGMVYGKDYVTSLHPFYFSVKLPEGNYNVKLLLAPNSNATIKAECRRLMVEKIETGNQSKTVAFTVHVKDSIIRSAAGNSKVK